MGSVTDVNPPSPRRRGRPSTGAREAIVDAARELFADYDYDALPTAKIRERAGVSRGAMYHHFPSKRALFAAAFEAAEVDAVARIAARALQAEGPLAQLRAGSLAYLDEATTNREVRRIGLRQSRRVLGWEHWRAIVSRHGLGLVRAGVQAAVAAGEMRSGDVEATADVLMAALVEAALLVSTAAEPALARDRMEPVLVDLLDGLRAR